MPPYSTAPRCILGTVRFLAVVLALIAVPALAAAESAERVATAVVGGQFEYAVQPGDSLTRIGARFGAAPSLIAESNGLDYDALLFPGQRLRIDNRHIVPLGLTSGMLINIPQRMLFLLRDGQVEVSYPVGLGRPTWPTPVGLFQVEKKMTDKAWNVPRSIREELRREQELVRTLVPPGPDNPLGKHWIGLSIRGYGIHGTIAPVSVFHFQSHGCIRMHADHIADLYERVSVGTQGRLVYEPVLVARSADDAIYLEVHRDVYRRAPRARQAVDRALSAAGLEENRVDWSVIEQALVRKAGVIVRVDRAD